MADQMKPTPRSPILGLFSDVLGRTLNMPSMPRTGIPSIDLLYANRNSLFNMMGVGDVQKTAERISYGEPLTTGQGMTTKPREETIGAAMAVAPFAPAAGRLASQTGRVVGRLAGQEINAAITGQPTRSLLGGITPKPKLLDVYHGTPHTLPPTERNPLGEFDASKIGTGEGAQAYGYGIYTAEAPAVAKEYQQKLSSTGSAKNLAKQYGGIDEGLAEAMRRVENYKQLIADGGGGAMERVKSLLRISEKNVEDLSRMKAGLPENTGNLYKIDLPDEKIATMLDWDKHLSDQSPEVQKILYPYQKEIGTSFVTGEQILKEIAFDRRMKGLDDSPSAVAQQLQEMGIAGVRYLDDASRGVPQKWVVNVPDFGGYDFSSIDEAQAFIKSNPQLKTELIEPKKITSNFVVFPNEEKSMTILERNGMPVGMGIKDVGIKYPQQAALDLAQQRAALPVDQGGLGLPANNTAMDRAKAMGFETSALHGSGTPDINAFDPNLVGTKAGNAFDNYMWFTSSPESASGYALNTNQFALIPDVKALNNQINQIGKDISSAYTNKNMDKVGDLRKELSILMKQKSDIYKDFEMGKYISEGSTTYPVLLKSNEFMPYEANNQNWMKANRPAIEESQSRGFQGVEIKNVKDNPNPSIGSVISNTYATENPDLIRSRFAAFDPFRKDVATATAMGVALPDLLAQPVNQYQNPYETLPMYTDPFGNTIGSSIR